MELRQLKYFVGIAEEGNIGRAAEKLNITQPPLTRQIKQLEEELDVLLFIRTPRGVELTAAGESFLKDARLILAQAGRGASRAKLAHAGQIGRLDISFWGSPIYKILPELLAQYQRAYPDVDITLKRMAKMEQIEALLDKVIHIGFSRSVPETPGLKRMLVCEEPLLLAVAKSSPFGALDAVSIQDLKGAPLILFPAHPRPSFADETCALCRRYGFEARIAAETEDASTAMALVAAGVGAALVPYSVSAFNLVDLRFLPLKEADITTDLYCVFNEENRTPTVDGLLDIIHHQNGY